jgi:hypothetical protein
MARLVHVSDKHHVCFQQRHMKGRVVKPSQAARAWTQPPRSESHLFTLLTTSLGGQVCCCGVVLLLGMLRVCLLACAQRLRWAGPELGCVGGVICCILCSKQA